MTIISDAMSKKPSEEPRKPAGNAGGGKPGAGNPGAGAGRERLSKSVYPVSSILRGNADSRPDAPRPTSQRPAPSKAPGSKTGPPVSKSASPATSKPARKDGLDYRIVAVVGVVLLAAIAGFVVTPGEDSAPAVQEKRVSSLDSIEAKKAASGEHLPNRSYEAPPASKIEGSGTVKVDAEPIPETEIEAAAEPESQMAAAVTTVSAAPSVASDAGAGMGSPATTGAAMDTAPPLDSADFGLAPLDLETQLVPRLDPDMVTTMPQLELPPALDYAEPAAGSAYDSSPAPAPARAPASIHDYRLEGIFWDDIKPAAIINDDIVEMGDEIDGLRVVRIDRATVTVEYKGREHLLR